MKHLLRNQISNNLMLKVTACILGILCWLKLTYDQNITCAIKMPLSFYNLDTTAQVNAPESLTVQLRANRAHLYTFDHKKSAIHIDMADLKKGKHTIAITSEKLFLPDGITMVHCMPCKIEIL